MTHTLPGGARPALQIRRLQMSGQEPHPISLQLVAWPQAGGGLFSFLPWLYPQARGGLAADVGLWGVELDWTARWTFDSLVAALTDAIEQERPALPLVLAGYSLGALLAFGVARQLRNGRTRLLGGSCHRHERAPELHSTWRRV